MSHADNALAGEICHQYLLLNDSKVNTPDITREKKRCKEAILEMLARHNATFMQVQDQHGNTKYIVKYGKQKMHPMSDVAFITFTVAAWCAVELKIILTEAQKNSFKRFLKASHLTISQRKYPVLIPVIKIEDDMPLESLPPNFLQSSL